MKDYYTHRLNNSCHTLCLITNIYTNDKFLFQIGLFPRCLVDPMRKKQPEDISKPLENSFIHTGHGEPFGKSWGSPTMIDNVYLRNPMVPPDIIGTTSFEHSKKHFSQTTPRSRKQFNYKVLQNELRSSPIKKAPAVPKPSTSQEGTLIDLSPEELANAAAMVAHQSDSARVVNIIDEPIDMSDKNPQNYWPEDPDLRTYANCPEAAAAVQDPFDTSQVFSSRYYSQVAPELLNFPQQYSNIERDQTNNNEHNSEPSQNAQDRLYSEVERSSPSWPEDLHAEGGVQTYANVESQPLTPAPPTPPPPPPIGPNESPVKRKMKPDLVQGFEQLSVETKSPVSPKKLDAAFLAELEKQLGETPKRASFAGPSTQNSVEIPMLRPPPQMKQKSPQRPKSQASNITESMSDVIVGQMFQQCQSGLLMQVAQNNSKNQNQKEVNFNHNQAVSQDRIGNGNVGNVARPVASSSLLSEKVYEELKQSVPNLEQLSQSEFNTLYNKTVQQSILRNCHTPVGTSQSVMNMRLRKFKENKSKLILKVY